MMCCLAVAARDSQGRRVGARDAGMPLNALKTPLAAAVVLSAAVVLGGCSGFPGLSNPEPPPVPEAPAELPSRYSAEEFVGRWGFAAYHKEPDRARTETAARGQCRQ